MSDNHAPGSNPNIPPPDPTDTPTSTYRPPTGTTTTAIRHRLTRRRPPAGPTGRPAGGWPDQTPQHWLEPLPGQDRQRRSAKPPGRRRATLVIVVAWLPSPSWPPSLSAVDRTDPACSNGMLTSASRNAASPPVQRRSRATRPSSSDASSSSDADSTITRAAECGQPGRRDHHRPRRRVDRPVLAAGHAASARASSTTPAAGS